MGYSTQQGETAQPQQGGTFEGGQTSGITSVPQKGGVFDGVLVIDGPAGPVGPPGPVGPTVNITASATATTGVSPMANVAVTTPTPGTENLAFAFTLPQGNQGPAGTVAVGTVTATKLAPNATPTVSISDTGTPSMGVLNFVFGIPQGAVGDLGVGTVTTNTLPAGSQATVTITERPTQIGTFDFVFGIPTGPQGPQGTAGAAATVNVGTTTTGAAGTQASVTNSGTTSAAVLNFTIPQGATGGQGPQGPSGPAGADGKYITSITAQTSISSGQVNVILTEVFNDSSRINTPFNFPLGNNNLAFGTGNPTGTPAIIPSSYVNTNDDGLWVYLTNAWVPIAGGGGVTTVVSNADGTIAVTALGNADYDVKIAKQNANDGQFLAWNNANSKWQPKTPDVNITDSLNQVTIVVEGSTPESFVPVKQVNVDTVGNLITVDVNGVDAVDANIINSNQLSLTGNRQLTSIVNGVQSNVIDLSNASGLSSVTLVEPTWRSVGVSTSGGIETITVTDNVQAQGNVFQGNTARSLVLNFDANIANTTWQAGASITITTTGIVGQQFSTAQTFSGTLPVANFFQTGNHFIADLNKALTLANHSDATYPNQEQYVMFPNTTPVVWTSVTNPTGVTLTPNRADTFLFNGASVRVQWTGWAGSIPSGDVTFNTSNGGVVVTSLAPTFRTLDSADIVSVVGTNPSDRQYLGWDQANAKFNWQTPVNQGIVVQDEGSVIGNAVTTINFQGNGVGVSGNNTGVNVSVPGTSVAGNFTDNIIVGNGLASTYDSANVDTTLSAALIAQDNGTAVSGTFYTINAGANLTASISNGVLTLNASGGGGGASIMATAVWTGGSNQKQAYNNATTTAQGTVNTQGVTITLTASSNVGQVSAATISFNGTAATGTYASTGTFPTYTITIPSGDIPVAAQTASLVNISINGTYDTVQSIIPCDSITNTQPAAASPFLSVAGQTLAARPYYNAAGTGTITASVNTGVGSIATASYSLDSGTAQSSGTFTGVAVGSHSVSASGTANGVRGAGIGVAYGPLSGTASISQDVYTPAFYLQNSSASTPTFSTAGTQTPGAGQGSSILYPTATASSQYNWVATDRPIGNLFLKTPFGNNPLTPNVTDTQSIGGVTLNVFGWTGLVVGQASTLIIT